jgi:hypothetical protein
MELRIFRGPLRNALNLFRHQTVYTIQNGIIKYHWVTELTMLNMRDLTVDDIPMFDYFANEHNIFLNYLDIPAFTSISGNVIPAERCYTVNECLIGLMGLRLVPPPSSASAYSAEV